MPENSIGLNFYTVLNYEEGMILGCLRTNSVNLAGLRDSSASASLGRGLKVCTTKPSEGSLFPIKLN